MKKDNYIQPHKNIPKDHFEEEQGQGGFYGAVSHLIKKKSKYKVAEY